MSIKVSDVFSIVPIDVPQNTSLVVAHRHVGLECERETVEKTENESRYFKRIQFKSDGSLRNNGKELVFNKPLAGKQILEALSELDYIFRNYTCTHSERTSDHIHVNIQDFTQEELYVLYHNLLVLEMTFFNIGKIKFNRVNNTYCMPHWEYLKIGPRYPGWEAWTLFNYPKYLSYRFCSSYGTIEFRMFESANSVSRQLGRINLCLEVVENSKKGIRIDINEPLELGLLKLCPYAGKQWLCAVQESPNIRISTSEFDISFIEDGTKRKSRTLQYLKKQEKEKLRERIPVSEIITPEALSSMIWALPTGQTGPVTTESYQVLSHTYTQHPFSYS